MTKQERKSLEYCLKVTKFRLQKAIQLDLENQESKQKFESQIQVKKEQLKEFTPKKSKTNEDLEENLVEPIEIEQLRQKIDKFKHLNAKNNER